VSDLRKLAEANASGVSSWTEHWESVLALLDERDALTAEVARLRESERIRALCNGCGADEDEGCVPECDLQVYR
jgi:hypothetical protein